MACGQEVLYVVSNSDINHAGDPLYPANGNVGYRSNNGAAVTAVGVTPNRNIFNGGASTQFEWLAPPVSSLDRPRRMKVDFDGSLGHTGTGTAPVQVGVWSFASIFTVPPLATPDVAILNAGEWLDIQDGGDLAIGPWSQGAGPAGRVWWASIATVGAPNGEVGDISGTDAWTVTIEYGDVRPCDPATPCIGCVPFVAITPIDSETFTGRNAVSGVYVDERNGTGPDGFGSASAFQATLDNYGSTGTDDEPYEAETRTFASHNAPVGATHARLVCRVFGHSEAAAVGTPAVGLDWILYAGTWGAGTPGWASVGAVLASGTVTPGATVAVPSAGYADVDADVPVVGGRAQFAIAFGAQAQVNAAAFNPPNWDIVAADRYPGFVPTDGQANDRVRTAHPDHYVSGESSKFYRLDWYDAAPGVPSSGQHVNDEYVAMGDGSTTAFTTNYPFAPHSLAIEVDGIRVGVYESDAATGEFHLAFAPDATERITATYQGA